MKNQNTANTNTAAAITANQTANTNTAAEIVRISNTERKDRIDAILGALVGLAHTYNKPHDAEQVKEEAAAYSKLERLIENLFCGVYAVPVAHVSCVTHECLIRAAKYAKGEFQACSGATFRKWVLNDMLTDRFGVDLSAHVKTAEKRQAKKKVRTVKNADGTTRPMTAEEENKYRVDKIASLEKQLAALRGEIA